MTSDTKTFNLKTTKLAQPQYTVTFKDWNGSVLKSDTVLHGQPVQLLHTVPYGIVFVM